MNQKKIIILLLAITIYINYKNYIEEDTQKIKNKIMYIKKRIMKEKQLSNTKQKKVILHDYQDLMYNGNNISYSEAMGKFQQIIEKTAKPACKILSIKWTDKQNIEENWYQSLNINLSLQCTPKAFIEFNNNLKKSKYLITLKQLHIIRERKEDAIRILVQVVSYRTKK